MEKEKLRTVEKETVIEFEEKKSKFIGYIKPVSTVNEAENFIKSIKELHPDATHNVPLFRVIENGQEYFKYNDDGEPSNTAGKPMAEILNILDVYNVALVATRYFGGIKLGAGGLVRAYSKSVLNTLEIAEIINMEQYHIFQLKFTYNHIKDIDTEIRNQKIRIIKKDYQTDVTYQIALKNITQINTFKEKFQNQINIQSLGEKFLEKQ